MNNWMMCKVKYTKQLDNGAMKRVTEPYLLAAMSFTDAEARIYEELDSVIRGEFNVVSIARQEIHDIFVYGDSDIWYKSKVTYENVDLDTDAVKNTSQTFLVAAGSVKEANERIKENLTGMMVDYKIKSVIETPIVEVFAYAQDLGIEISRTPAEETVE